MPIGEHRLNGDEICVPAIYLELLYCDIPQHGQMTQVNGSV